MEINLSIFLLVQSSSKKSKCCKRNRSREFFILFLQQFLFYFFTYLLITYYWYFLNLKKKEEDLSEQICTKCMCIFEMMMTTMMGYLLLQFLSFKNDEWMHAHSATCYKNLCVWYHCHIICALHAALRAAMLIQLT